MNKTTRYRAAILDWAGTTIDHGSNAPTRVFREVFAARGVKITAEEARGPMGRAKIDHIAAVAAMPEVTERWRATHGAAPTDADIRAMYEEFLPLQRSILAEGCEVIPGVLDAIAALRAAGLSIGTTTGYTKALMEVVTPLAAAAGFEPDAVVCSDEVAAGRPAPWSIFRAAEELGVYPMERVLVADDTPVGVEAARNAGAVAVGISLTGNMLGLTAEEAAALSPAKKADIIGPVEERFREAGAHYVVESVADLPGLL